MKRLLFAAAVLLAVAVGARGFADDVNHATANGAAGVIILPRIDIAQSQGLDFGAITSGGAGTVALDPASGARAISGGVGAVADSVGKAGAFTITGQSNAAITVVVGAAITGFAGGITGATRVSSLPRALTGTSATFTVGGALTVPAGTPPGSYVGAYTVAVNYP